MKVSGTAILEASRDKVWPLVFDPSALIGMIPGCRRLEQVGPGRYQGEIQIGVAAVSGVYQTVVTVVEQEAPSRCYIEGEVSGPTGVIKGNASFMLSDAGGRTLLAYEGQALITGALANMNPRFIEGVVDTLIRFGLARLNDRLRQDA